MNFKNMMILSGLSATVALTSLTGCATWREKTSERSEGRMVDDHMIASRVKSNLKSEPIYKFTDIDVKAFNGVVQLSGFVSSEEQKRRAAEIAQQTPGVIQVENNISLKPQTYAPTGRSGYPNQPAQSQPYQAPVNQPR